ncbi:MAG TPA: 16S rRNA (guanine(966)-N(2))-methyltransferase RsmD [Candidatus Saccharimonadales bacterium]|nr:16S rRNA (guanine(966)-N(2))-methyltransferase RsmD [Candidatus Saccharimonadales bacterium]
MRIIAGALGGRQFDSPGTHRTHPMSDKMRGALFNILGDVTGLSILDSFGGSGALGFEALSRGADKVVVIETDEPAHRVIQRNIERLGLHTYTKSINASANAWLQTNPDDIFDVVLCDPPYDDLQPELLAHLAERVTEEGIFVLSYPAGKQLPDFTGLQQVKQKAYGDSQLVFYKRIDPSSS